MGPLSTTLEPEGVTTRSAHPWFSVAHFSGSSSKKVSLLACGRADDQKGDEGEGLEKITEAEKGALRRGAGRGGVISQNWRDRTSAFFAVLGS